ncbi:Retrotransposon protein [Abeliophyllum distichum]|uniref:Retrotransposon protein n=1 Tax=Abeliophyllum distichum TaxID=126358 RepID=A0ABD1QB14_9LAMI
MDLGKDLESNLSDFSKIVKSLDHNDNKFDDEDLAIILLNSLPDSYRDVRNANKYARDVLTKVIVIDALRSKDLELKKESRRNTREESLFIRGKNEIRENNYQGKKGRGKYKGVLEGDGCMFKSNFGTSKILKGSLVVMKGPKRNGLYYLQGEALHAKDSGMVSINTNRSDLWHRRMGHIGKKGLKYLSDQNLLGKDTVAPLSFCEMSVLEKSHRVSFEIGLAKGFWVEALYTTAYLINKSPSSFVNFKTLQELWSRKSPDLSHIRVFRCAAYAHQVEGKLDPRATKCVMLGYLEGVKGYRLWVLSVKGIKRINSRDVKFNELDMHCLKTLDNQVKQSGEDESSTGKKI